MRVVYCTSCREMIDRKDIESGKAILYNKSSYCPKCTLEASWSDSSRAEPIQSKNQVPPVGSNLRRRSSTPQGGSPGQTRRPSSGIEPVRGRRRPTSGELPAGGLDPATPPSPLRKRSSAGAAASNRNTVLIAAISVGAALCVGIVVVAILASGNGGSTDGNGSKDGGSTTPETPPDTRRIIYEKNVEEERKLTASIEDGKSAVRMWRESLTALQGSDHHARAQERLRSACQRLFERTASQASIHLEKNDAQAALALWNDFRDVVDLDPWREDARSRIAEIEARRNMPRPDATWMLAFDGASIESFCPDQKHYTTWKHNGSVLVGQLPGAGDSWIHFRNKVKNCNVAIEYRILSGGFVVKKQNAAEVGLPATTDEAVRSWHEAVVQFDGRNVKVWVDGQPIDRVYPAADAEEPLGFSVRPGSEVEIRKVRIQPLP